MSGGLPWRNPDTGAWMTPGYGDGLLGGGGGSQGLLASPLLHFGLGILAANQPGTNTMQAVGRGGLLGLNSYNQAQNAQIRGLLGNAQLGQYAMEADKYRREGANADAIRQRYGFGPSGKGGAGLTAGSLSGAPSNIPPAGRAPGMGGGEPAGGVMEIPPSLGGTGSGPAQIPIQSGAAPGQPAGPLAGKPAAGSFPTREQMLAEAQFLRAHGQTAAANQLEEKALGAPSGYRPSANGLAFEPGGPHDPATIERESLARSRGSLPSGFDRTPSGGLAPIPGGPNDPATISRETGAREATQRAYNPLTREVKQGDRIVTQEFVPGQGWRNRADAPRWEDPENLNKWALGVVKKVQRDGLNSLTPQEREAWDMYVRTSPQDQLMRGIIGGMPGAAPSSSPAPSAAPSGASIARGTQSNPHSPKSKGDFDMLKKGDFYVDPGDGQLYRKR